jgi:hypothetical protein
MPQHRSGACRRRPAARLVRVSQITRRYVDLNWKRQALAESYGVGVRGAAHCRRLFPDFWQQHVAYRPVTPVTLLGVAQAFTAQALNMVECFELMVDRMQIVGDPVALLDPGVDDQTALDILEEEAEVYIDRPPAMVYGLGGGWLSDVVCADNNLLALAIWQMVDQTSWATSYETDYLDDFIAHRLDAAFLAALPRLPARTAMMDLVAALDRQDDRQLGTLLRYVCNMADNAFATITPEEAEEDFNNGYGTFSWDGGDLQALADRQREAERWYEQYDALDDRCTADRAVLSEIIWTIADTARQLPEPSTALIDLVADETPDREPFDYPVGDDDDEPAEITPVAALAEAHAPAMPV